MGDSNSNKPAGRLIALLLTGIFLTDAFCAPEPDIAWNELALPSRGQVTALASVRGQLWAGTDQGNLYRSETGKGPWILASKPSSFPAPATGIVSFGSSLYAGFGMILDLGLWDCAGGPSACGPNPLESGGIYRSDDGGVTWTARSLKAVTDLHAYQDVLYAATLGGLYASGDGQDWRRLRVDQALRLDQVAIRRIRRASSEIFLLTGGGVIRATLSGDSLIAQGSASLAGNGQVFTGLVANGSDVLASTSTALYHTRPGHALWDTVAEPGCDRMEEEDGTVLAFRGSRGTGDAHRPALILTGPADGRGWTSAPAGEAGLPAGAPFSRHLGTFFRAAGDNGVDWLSPSGPIWVPGPAGINERPVSPLRVEDGRVWAEADGIRHRSLAGGDWERDSVPVSGGRTRMASTPGYLWVATDAGLWARGSSDGRWTRWLQGEVTALAVSGTGVTAAVERGPIQSRDHFLAFCGGSGPCRETPPGLLGRTTGLDVSPPVILQRTMYNQLGFAMRSGDTVLAADSLLYRSRDGGNTWDTVGGGNLPYAAGLAWAGGRLFRHRPTTACPQCLQRSDDLGSTWTALPFEGPGESRIVRLLSDGRLLFLLTEKGLLRGEDGSRWTETWKGGSAPVALALGGGYVAASDAGNRLWVAALPETHLAIRSPSIRTRARAPAPKGFIDGLGRPRKANGALGRGESSRR